MCGFGFDKMFDAFGFGDDNHAIFADGESASSIVVVVVADFDAGRNMHALVDNGPANFGVATDIDPFKQDRVFHAGETVDTRV